MFVLFGDVFLFHAVSFESTEKHEEKRVGDEDFFVHIMAPNH